MIKEFNASQDKYEVKGVYKGNYDEAMTAAIAAFRAKQHPNLIQIFEVGTASMMAAKGAIRPVYEIMEAAGTPVDTSKLLGSVASYYSSTDGKLIAMPFNASTTVLYYNKDAVKKAGGDPDHFPTTWPEVAELAKKIKESGACKYGLTSGWQSWVQLESFSAWHNVPFATNNNGYDGLDTKLLFNSPLHVKHIDFLSKLQKDGVMVYVGRKSEAINAAHLRRSRHPHELLRLLRRREGRCQVPVGRGAAPLLARREGRSPEHRDRRRSHLGHGRTLQGRRKGRRRVPELPPQA